MIFVNVKNQRIKSGIAASAAIFLTAVISLSLCACGTVKTAGVSPAISDVPVVTGTPVVPTESSVDVSLDTGPTGSPLSAIPAAYSEYALNYKTGGKMLQIGVQDDLYPLYLIDEADMSAHTSADAPGTVFYRIEGAQYRLFLHHIEATGKDVISTYMTASDMCETTRGISVGDTVEKLLQVYDNSLLYEPKPFPISQDLGGDFCVYDELFVYTRPEDDNCCIVFYVAARPDRKTITGIEISLGQDGGPRYSADNTLTFAVDQADPEKYTKTDTSAEEKVHKLLLGLDTTAQPSGNADGMSAILEAMADFNWSIYSSLYTNAPMDLIDWLYGQKITEEKDILYVLKATKGLDGAYSEGYASVIGNIYLSDSERFIRLASRLSNWDIDNIAKLLCYGLSDKKDQVESELKALRSGGTMTAEEQYVINDILYYYDHWY